MALQYTSAVQNQVALLVYGKQYAALLPDEKQLIDAAGAVPTSAPGGQARYAFNKVAQIAQGFAQAGATAPPDVWEGILCYELAVMVALKARHDMVPGLARERADQWNTLTTSFTLDEYTAPTLAEGVVHVQGIRFYVLNRALEKRSPRFPSTAVIDQENRWVREWLWNRSGWRCRMRPAIMRVRAFEVDGGTYTAASKRVTKVGAFTDYVHAAGNRFRATEGSSGADLGDYVIAARVSDDAIDLASALSSGNLASISGWTVGVDFIGLGDGEVFDSTASRQFYYDDDLARQFPLAWLGPDDLANAKAYGGVASAGGRPRHFHIEERSAYKVWHFSPEPDGEYKARGHVYIEGPGTPANATAVTVYEKFPREWRAFIPEMVFARVMMALAKTLAEKAAALDLWKEVEKNVSSLLPAMEGPGAADSVPVPHDHYHDLDMIARTTDQGSVVGGGL